MSSWWWAKYLPKHVEQLTDLNKLYSFASCWIIIATLYDARSIEHKTEKKYNIFAIWYELQQLIFTVVILCSFCGICNGICRENSVKVVSGYGLDNRRSISFRQRVCTVYGRQPVPLHLILNFVPYIPHGFNCKWISVSAALHFITFPTWFGAVSASSSVLTWTSPAVHVLCFRLRMFRWACWGVVDGVFFRGKIFGEWIW